MRIFLSFFIAIFLFNPSEAQVIEYPPISKSPVSTAYFDTTLVDGYSALENIISPETQVWLKSQRKISRRYLRKIRNKQSGFSNLNRLGYTKFNLPTKSGKYYYKRAYFQTDIPPGLFYQSKIESDPDILINPLDISTSDEISLGAFSVSKNDKYLAFTYGRNGSDWREIRIKKLSFGGGYLKDRIFNAKFTQPLWRGEGFYYLKYNRRDQFSPELTPELYYHKLKTKQEEDELIFRKKSTRFYDIDLKVTADERFLLIYQKDEAAGELTIYVKDFAAEKPALKPLFLRTKESLHILGNDGDTFYALTGKEARNGTIVKFNLNEPTKWKMVLPEVSDAVLIDVRMINNLFVCEYIQNTQSVVIIFDKSGEVRHTLPFDSGFSVGGFSGGENDTETIYYMTSYFVPPVVYKLDLNTFESKLIKKTEVSFDFREFQVVTGEFPSKDGTMIPMTIFSKKGIKLDGNNPVLLKTYGGFGSIHVPSFDEGLVFFIKEGGIFAYAHVRGEGNLGRAWSNAGRHLNDLVKNSNSGLKA